MTDPADALSTLAGEAGGRLIRLAYQLCHDRATAEDIVQEALIRVLTSLQKSDRSVSSMEAYVRKAIVNEVLRRRRLASAAEVIMAVIPESAMKAGSTIASSDPDATWDALGALTTRERTVMVLRYYLDLPDAEIGVLTGWRPATVRSLAARALRKLRFRVEQERQAEDVRHG